MSNFNDRYERNKYKPEKLRNGHKKTTIASSFLCVDMSKLVFPAVTIYLSVDELNRRTYICRLWDFAEAIPTDMVIIRSSIDACRYDLNLAGFDTPILREERDAAEIVESWI